MVGGDESKQVQSINFDGVDDITSAQAKQWTMLGTLTYEVCRAGIQFYNNQLFVISSTDSSFNNGIQSFDLSSNTTKISGV